MPGSVLKAVTVMLLDNHAMVRQGIELALGNEADLHVVGSFGTGRELLDALALRLVDVVVMDFALGPDDIDGLNLIRTLARRFSRCKPVVVSSHYTPATVSLALKAGSWGVVGKIQNLAELITAIRTVAEGRIYLQACMVLALQVGRSLVGAKPGVEGSTPFPLADGLTPKEQEVLRCFMDGMTVNAIAAKFSRSASTISTQKQSAYRKLGIKSDSELFKVRRQFGEL